MRVIIADTSCLILYDKLGRWDILQQTFEDLRVTEEVAQEFGELPAWIKVETMPDRSQYRQLLNELGAGEASSIALALSFESSLLIIDEKRGRKKAQEYDLDIIGSLGILLKAKQAGVIDAVKPILEQINQTNFRLSNLIWKEVLREAGES